MVDDPAKGGPDPFSQTLSSKKTRRHVSVWYYGDPGAGKTTDLALGTKLGRTAVFTIEPGIEPVALERLGVDPDLLVLLQDKTRSAILDRFWDFKKSFKNDPKDKQFQVVAFDSFTELIRREIRTIQDETFAKEKARVEARGEVFNGDKSIEWSKVGPELSDDIGDIAEHYHDLPVHLAYTSHVRDDPDGSGGIVYSPAVTPGVKKALAGYCNIQMLVRQVGRYSDGRLVYIGTTAEGGKYKVKDRTGQLPSPHMVNPTMERIVKYYTGDLTVETDPEQQEFQTWNENRKKAKSA